MCTYVVLTAGEPMIKQLTRTGNSYALVLDRAILELMKIEPDTPLDISTDGRRLIITPVIGADRRKKFREALEWTNRKHGKTLKRLSE